MAALFALSLFLFASTFSWAGDGSSPSLCGISLRPASAHLLHYVEHRFAKPVRCELATNLAQSEGARANERLDVDGTPVVRLDSGSGRTETEVVHELFHLQLRALGFPQDFAITVPPSIDGNILQLAARDISAMLEHRLFYPKMRQMGLDPTKAYRDEVENHIAHERPPSYSSRYPQLLVIDYATVLLVINDPPLTRRMRMWYAQHGWQDALRRGRNLANYILRLNPDTPPKMRTALSESLKTVFNDTIEIQWSLEPGSAPTAHPQNLF